MGVETGDFISDLNEAWPLGGDERKFGDDHFRMIKHVLRYAFANGATSLTINAGTSEFTFNQDGSILVNGTPLAAGIPEAPIDGLIYGRSDGGWTEVVTGAGAGGSAPGEWAFNNATAEPPGGGQIRLNNATQASATKIYIAETTATGVDVANALRFNLKVGSQIYLQNKDNSSQWHLFNITGTPVDDGTYWDVPVTFAEGGSSLPDGQRTVLSILPPTVNTTEFVKKSGDTMTGGLIIDGYGLQVGGATKANIDVNGGGAFVGGVYVKQIEAGNNARLFFQDETGGTKARYYWESATSSLNWTLTSATPLMTLTTSRLTTGVQIALPSDPSNPLDAATKQYVDLRAPLASPTFTGDPKAPTPATADNDTSIATTAYVKANLATIASGATVSDTAPATPQSGQLWFQSSSGRVFVWYVDANSSQWVQVAPGPASFGGASKIKETSFLSSGIWTPDPKMLFTRFFLVGGGGGGGGAQAYAANNFAVGGGGSSGQHRDVFRDKTVILAAGSSFTVTVGALGAGGVGGMGSQGGDSSISPSISGLFAASGGQGGSCYASAGTNSPVYAPGGAGSNGFPGSPGLVLYGPTPFVGWGGNGGQSVLGWGYGSGSGNSDGGTASANSGSGGGGGVTWVYTTVKNGGNGGKGVVYITEFLSE